MKTRIQGKRLNVALTVSAAALGAAALAGLAAGQGQAAHPNNDTPSAQVVSGVLTVEGTKAGDQITLRLKSGDPNTLEVDFGDDGAADFSFPRAGIARIAVDAGNGDDSVLINENNPSGVFTDTIPTVLDGGDGNDVLTGGAGAGTLSGGNGNDTLNGGSGAEFLLGGDGNDSIDGNRGNDVALMGNCDDTFTWDPGDGSDTIEGQNGKDAMVFNGAGVVDTVDLSANGSHLTFFRQPANITMDTNGVERVDFNALGSADIVNVNDLTGTDVRDVSVNLAGTLGGATGDGAADRVVVNGTKVDDKIKIKSDAEAVKVSGLVPTVEISHSEGANDRLEINTGDGNDKVNSHGLAAGVIQLFVDGVLVP